MSRRKDALSWGLIVLVLLLVGVATVYVLLPKLRPQTTLHLGDGVFSAQLAKTEKSRVKGFWASLTVDQAVILAYDKDAKWSVSTKVMKQPTDIVWLNKDKKVVYIVKNATPTGYPYEVFEPKEEARYVVGLVAGTVAKKAIIIDTEASFDEDTRKEALQ